MRLSVSLTKATINLISTMEKNCVFCKIIRKEAPGESIYEDDEVICIKDIKPASTYHYLIIPKRHISTPKDLKKEDEELYDKMVATVDVIAEKQGFKNSSIRTGFHWPPFNTVNHLHLHVISPVEAMGFVQRSMFKPDSFWFVSTDYVKSRFATSS